MATNPARIKRRGFTIVELLIVVVVIAVLAAITIVAYSGIQQRTQASSAQATVSQLVRKIELYKVANGSYPSDLAAAEVSVPSDYSAVYAPNAGEFCVAVVKGGVSTAASSSAPKPASGGCIPRNGLVAEWLFNGNANDTSGSGMNGTPSGATLTTGQNGQANGAYSFSGSTQYISLASSTPLNFTTSQFSVSSWVNVSTLPATATWYDILSSTGASDWSFGINATAAGVGRWMMTKVSQTDAPAGPTVEQNSWRHLAAVYTYGPAPSTVAYYLDGTLTATVNWNHSAQGAFVPATKRIGSRAASGYFRGAIDDTKVYDRALASAEITSIFAAGAQ